MQTTEQLIQHLNNPDATIRKQSQKAILEKGAEVVAPLIKAITNNDAVVAARVINLLADLGDGRVIQPIIDALDHENLLVRMNAAQALGNFNDNTVIKALC